VLLVKVPLEYGIPCEIHEARFTRTTKGVQKFGRYRNLGVQETPIVSSIVLEPGQHRVSKPQ
jgi:hypothetical protein